MIRLHVPRGPCAAALLLSALIWLGTGCGGPPRVAVVPFSALNGVAAVDSLGLDTFLSLTPSERASRRAEAAAYLQAAQSASTDRAYTRALLAAAGLAPDDPAPWLDLAHTWRWVGDYLQTETCLDNATAAVKAWGAPGTGGTTDRAARDAAALRIALLRAWLAYDRAVWRDGLSWARAAAEMKEGKQEAWCIEGLLSGALGRHADAHQAAADLQRRDPFNSDAAWILAVLARGRGEDRPAFDRLVHGQPGQGTLAELRPERDHAAACFRDMGSIAETVAEWGYARRWYSESAAALPVRHTDGVSRVQAPRLGPPDRRAELPVWLADGRYYVTGSLAAYADLAYRRFSAATGPEREFWAGATVNATGILVRRGVEAPWAQRTRGLVFAGLGQGDRGLADLQRAAASLETRGQVDAELEAAMGHLLLLKEDADGARDHLRRAVAGDPGLAGAWSDLGLALVMEDDRRGALAAFDRALSLDPGLVTAWYNRGLMHLHAGELDAAESDLAEAASLAPDNPDVARVLQQLQARRRGP